VIDYAGLQADAERNGRHCVVGAVIRDGAGRIFVHCRSWKRALFPGCWDIVSGHVELGEGLLDALARESMEETGWTLAGVRQLAVVSDWETAGDNVGNPGPQPVRRRREFDFLVEARGDIAREATPSRSRASPSCIETPHRFGWATRSEATLSRARRQ